jgi:hypothetical protein
MLQCSDGTSFLSLFQSNVDVDLLVLLLTSEPMLLFSCIYIEPRKQMGRNIYCLCPAFSPYEYSYVPSVYFLLGTIAMRLVRLMFMFTTCFAGF